MSTPIVHTCNADVVAVAVHVILTFAMSGDQARLCGCSVQEPNIQWVLSPPGMHWRVKVHAVLHLDASPICAARPHTQSLGGATAGRCALLCPVQSSLLTT